MNNVKVYKMNDYEWWASKLDERETLDYYLEYCSLDEKDNPLEEVIECDLDKEGMWWYTEKSEDIERLGDVDEIVNCETIGNTKRRKPKFGSLMRSNDDIFKFTSFRDVLKEHGDFIVPFCLATTEW